MEDLPDIRELKEAHIIDEHSLRLDVIVHGGYNLAQSYWRVITSLGFDRTLDPYVRLSVTHPARRFENFAEELTTAKDDEPNPQWNESFSFVIDVGDGNRGDLVIAVWDDNYGPDTKYSDDFYINLNRFNLGAPYRKERIDIWRKAYLEISVRLRRMKLDIRLGYNLHPAENRTVKKRKKRCADTISRLLDRKVPVKKAPVVSVIGSGGGFRAMTGMCGAVQALWETALLDCCTYVSTLSGSTWYVSNLFTTDGGPDVYTCGSYLRERCNEMERIMRITRADDYIREIYQRYLDGLNISLVDLWECYLSSIFEPDKKNNRELAKKVSHQRPHVENANFPFPVYSAISVKDDLNERSSFSSEWVEFTPYEYGISKFGTFYKIEDLAGSKCCGVVCRKYPELDQTYLIALWGSAFAASIEVIAENTLGKSKKSLLKSLMKGLIDATGLDSLRPFAAVLPHMFYGLKVPPLLYRVSHTIETAFVSFPRAVMGVLGGVGHEMGAHEHHLEAEIKKGRQKRAGPQNKGPGVGDGIKRDVMLDDTMVVVDGGLAFNLPFPALLRAERSTDVFIVFDFTWNGSQTAYPFGELEKAAAWANVHKVKFPRVRSSQFDSKNLKEYYVFEDENDPDCPIVVLFPLCNASRRHKTIYGQDETYANVSPFEKCYETTHFALSTEQFSRLKELVRYNVTCGFEAIRNAIEKKTQQ